MREYRTSKILAGGIGLFVILGAAWYFVSSRTASNRLNVIIVTLDTTRADRVGCYGYPSAQTPVMDELAKTGVLFQFARTPYPLTLPAHASIMTALNPPEHGLQSNGRGRLNQRIPVLAEILARSKYDTGAFIARRQGRDGFRARLAPTTEITTLLLLDPSLRSARTIYAASRAFRRDIHESTL